MYWVQTQCVGHCFRNWGSKKNQTEWWSYIYRACTLVEGDRLQLSLKRGRWSAKKPKVLMENREGSETELLFYMQICNWSLSKQNFFLGTGKQTSFLLQPLPLLIHLEELVLSYAWWNRKLAPGLFWLPARLFLSQEESCLLSRFHAQSLIQKSHFI